VIASFRKILTNFDIFHLEEMSLEKFGFKAIQSSESSFTSSKDPTTMQDLLTHISSLQGTVAAVQGSLIYLEKKTKEYSPSTNCTKCIMLRAKLNDTHLELQKRRSQKEMLQRIKTLEKRVKELERENLRLKYMKTNKEDKEENNNDNKGEGSNIIKDNNIEVVINNKESKEKNNNSDR
jgi:arginyl-tRNA--protein-N-Asp/Glu arginylyltransferase